MLREPVPYIKTVSIANPAAGAELRVRAPGEGLWRVLSLAFVLVTDANVADRGVSLVASDGTSEYFVSGPTTLHQAAETHTYSAFEGSAGLLPVSGDVIFAFPARGLWMPSGHQLVTETTSIQVGDQYSAITVLVEEFPNGPALEWAPTVTRGRYPEN